MPLCPTCEVILGQLGELHPDVEPISLYRKPSRLRDWLSYYKSGSDEFVPDNGRLLRELLEAFFRCGFEHGRRWAPDAYDCFVVIPSARREGPHPLVEWVEPVLSEMGLPAKRLLEPGPEAVGHRLAAPRGFTARRCSGLRVLVVDDVYTTGARAHSATFALRQAGAVVGPVIPIGRRINPDFSEADRNYWQTCVAATVASGPTEHRVECIFHV